MLQLVAIEYERDDAKVEVGTVLVHTPHLLQRSDIIVAYVKFLNANRG